MSFPINDDTLVDDVDFVANILRDHNLFIPEAVNRCYFFNGWLKNKEYKARVRENEQIAAEFKKNLNEILIGTCGPTTFIRT